MDPVELKIAEMLVSDSLEPMKQAIRLILQELTAMNERLEALEKGR